MKTFIPQYSGELKFKSNTSTFDELIQNNKLSANKRLIIRGELSEKFENIIDRVNRAISYKVDSDGKPISPPDVAAVTECVHVLHSTYIGFHTPVIFPTSKSGLQIEWHWDKWDINITINPDEAVLVHAYDKTSKKEVEEPFNKFYRNYKHIWAE